MNSVGKDTVHKKIRRTGVQDLGAFCRMVVKQDSDVISLDLCMLGGSFTGFFMKSLKEVLF